MMNFFKNIFSLLKMMRVLHKHQIIMHNEYIKLPFFIKLVSYISCIFLAPTKLLFAPKKTLGKRLNNALQELGPIYIKLGQAISTRPDFVGTDIAEELKYLQDKLPSFDIDIVKKTIKSGLKQDINEIFAEFDETPIAAASIAQVHRAKLPTGELVAIKILRPDIYNIYEKDIKFLEFWTSIVGKFTKKFQRLKLLDIISVFRKSMEFELNLLSEAASSAEVKKNFKGDDSIEIPKIFWQLSTSEILVSEWIDGVSIYDKDSIIKMGHAPKEIATKLAVIFFNMAFRDGYFHADLHPGNVLVTKEGKIALIDFGIIGVLAEKDRLGVAEILYHFVKRDYMAVAQIHKRINYIPQDTNLEDFAQSCRSIAEPIFGLESNNISIGNLLSRLLKITEQYGMNTQPQLLLLQKTMVLTEGIGNSLDKDLIMWQQAEPWIKKWAGKNLSPEAKALRFIKNIFNKI